METYERLIRGLGRGLLTKGLNNDAFTVSGRVPEMALMRREARCSVTAARQKARGHVWPHGDPDPILRTRINTGLCVKMALVYNGMHTL